MSSVLRWKAAASRGMIASTSPLAPPVLNGPVEQLKISAAVGRANDPMPGKVSRTD